MREYATTGARELTQTERDNIGAAVRKISALKQERGTAKASRAAAIDTELRRLNAQCNAIAQRRG